MVTTVVSTGTPKDREIKGEAASKHVRGEAAFHRADSAHPGAVARDPTERATAYGGSKGGSAGVMLTSGWRWLHIRWFLPRSSSEPGRDGGDRVFVLLRLMERCYY